MYRCRDSSSPYTPPPLSARHDLLHRAVILPTPGSPGPTTTSKPSPTGEVKTQPPPPEPPQLSVVNPPMVVLLGVGLGLASGRRRSREEDAVPGGVSKLCMKLLRASSASGTRGVGVDSVMKPHGKGRVVVTVEGEGEIAVTSRKLRDGLMPGVGESGAAVSEKERGSGRDDEVIAPRTRTMEGGNGGRKCQATRWREGCGRVVW